MTAIVMNGRSICMAEETVQSIMLLNKLWIPDVLIDLIKDYLYINTTTVLSNFYKASINMSISRLTVECSDMIDTWGRTRQIHWMKGHVHGECEVQLQNVICVMCGESADSHFNLDKCCAMEGDEEDGNLELFDGDLYDWEEEEEEEDWDW